MPDRILALHRLDLGTAAQLAAQLSARAGGASPAPIVTVFDPVLLSHAQANGLPQVRLLATPDCDIPHGANARALAATRLLCAAVDEVLAGLVPESVGAAWCGFWLQYLHLAVYGYRNIGRAMAAALAGSKVHVLLPDLPHRYGYHSFVPGLVLSDTLRAAGVAVQLYTSPLPAWDAPLLADPFSGPAADTSQRASQSGPAGAALDAAGNASHAPIDLLCHLPTCFYDHALFAAEIAATGQSTLVLPSQVFDVALPGLSRCHLVSPELLASRLSAAQRGQIEATLDRLGSVLSAHFLPLLPGAGLLQAQVKALLAGYRQQALLFFALDQRFAARPPKTLLLSNHDAGQHGALFSFARRHQIRTVLLPHSKIYNEPITSHGHDLLCLTHPLQGGEVQDLDSSPLRTGVLDFAEAWADSGQRSRSLASLGILLNGFSSNAMCLVDVTAYMAGLARLRDWCVANGVACHIRCRPNASAMALVCASLGAEAQDLIAHQQGTVAEFGAGCDLVLGYDVPTSGALELLRHGVPVMQALCRRLASQEWRIVSPAVVPQLPLDDVLARLAGFHQQPALLWAYQREQVGRYLQARAPAQPLRAWL